MLSNDIFSQFIIETRKIFSYHFKYCKLKKFKKKLYIYFFVRWPTLLTNGLYIKKKKKKKFRFVLVALLPKSNVGGQDLVKNGIRPIGAF